jgi:hypothetical protein
LTFRLSATASILIACAAAAYVAFGAGVDALHLARWLAAHDYPGYAAWLGWMVLAPLVLIGAALGSRRTPWPWVLAVSLHLAGLVAGQARLADLTDGWMWVLVATAVAIGLASIVSVLDDR